MSFQRASVLFGGLQRSTVQKVGGLTPERALRSCATLDPEKVLQAIAAVIVIVIVIVAVMVIVTVSLLVVVLVVV